MDLYDLPRHVQDQLDRDYMREVYPDEHEKRRQADRDRAFRQRVHDAEDIKPLSLEDQ